MQKVMNILFSMTGTGEICIPSMIDTAINDLLDFSADTYDALLYQMPEKQRIVFMAIAAEGKARLSQAVTLYVNTSCNLPVLSLQL